MNDYRRIQPGEPMYEMVEANKAAGRWVCDSYDHNESQGCSNPGCFKFKQLQKELGMWKGRAHMVSLAALLDKRDSKLPNHPYTSRMHFYPDGTPADAVGLWAMSNTDRWDIYRGPFNPYPYPALRNLDDLLTPSLRLTAKGYIGPSIRTLWSLMFDFDMSMTDVQLIFNTNGCAGADTAEKAARYVKGFVGGYEARMALGHQQQYPQYHW